MKILDILDDLSPIMPEIVKAMPNPLWSILCLLKSLDFISLPWSTIFMISFLPSFIAFLPTIISSIGKGMAAYISFR